MADHSSSCTGAEGTTCTCSCGNALHGGVKTQGVIAEAICDDKDEVEKLRDESRDKADENRWVSTGTSNQAGAHIVNEFIIGLIEHKIAVDTGNDQSIEHVDLSENDLVVVHQLSDTIAGEIVSKMEGHLQEGGPRKKKEHHFFCVVLAAVCQAYEKMNKFLGAKNEELAWAIVDLIDSLAEGEECDPTEPSPRTIETSKTRKRKNSFTLLDGERDFFYQVVLKVLEALRKSAMAPIEEGVMLHLRVIASITCPDPDCHPSIIKYCIWPLLKGPLKKMISDEAANEMGKWIEDAYPTLKLEWEPGATAGGTAY